MIIEDGVRMVSAKDIAAMKLVAIAQRGSKKDFFDLYELLERYSLETIFDFFRRKFPGQDPSYVIRSLTYFDDGELQADPIMLKDYSRQQVKDRMIQVVQDYMKG